MKKGIKVLSLVGGFLFSAYLFSWFMSPGSYSRAEVYTFNLSKDSLLLLIDEFRLETPSCNNDEISSLNHEDRHRDFRYFYYSDKDLKIMTYVRGSYPAKFGFIRTSPGLDLGNWKNVNDSFWWWKNIDEKEEFEKRIVNPIRNKISR
jgi:hypothetical protein